MSAWSAQPVCSHGTGSVFCQTCPHFLLSLIMYRQLWHFARCRWSMMNCRRSLLAPGVIALLHYVRRICAAVLLAALWNTGARINEALALTPGDFSLAPPYPFVQLATLKRRTERTANRGSGGA